MLKLEKSYLHQNWVELNFLFIGMASRPAISFRINPRIREDSKGVPEPTLVPIVFFTPNTMFFFLHECKTYL